MRGFIGLCLLITGLSIGAYSHYPGPAHREASLAELTEIVTGAIHSPNELGAISRSAKAAGLKVGTENRTRPIVSHDAQGRLPPLAQIRRRGWFANSKILDVNDGASDHATKTPVLVSTPTQIAVHKKPKSRVLAIKEPPTLVHPKPTHHAARRAVSSGWRTAVVRVDAAPVRKGKRTASLKPKTNAERWKLVKLIQAELKRVGCYWGRVDGVWGNGSKWAMADFMKSVNAALPTKDPDYIQLQLISSHTTKICGRSNDGVQIAARNLPKVHQPQSWRTKVAHASNTTATSSDTYRLVTGALPKQNSRIAVVKHPRPAPLPGRMAVGVLDRAPTLEAPPKREFRRTTRSGVQQRIKVSALSEPAAEIDLEGQHARSAQFNSDQDGLQPVRSNQVNPFVAKKPSAAKASRAQAVRKASLRKKRRRYRNRYRRRSVQSLFTHPLGRR